jgi:photosystem II stability/assembly factor-like uncharacterized protein
VEGYLLDALIQAGVRCHSEAAFALGVPRLLEFERAVQESQRTLLVLSPAYRAEGFTQFADLLAQSHGLETATWPVIPLILQPVELPPRLAMLQALDATDSADWPDVLERLCAELQRPVPGPAPRPPCPYPGMVSFSEADSDRFFGRDQEVQNLVQQLRLHPFLTVIGPSGSGKSSLVFAGLVPALRQSNLFGPGDWLVRTLRPGQAPLAALADTLDGDPANPIQATSELLAARPDARRLLLVVDQFEELFTRAQTGAEPFQQALQRLATTPNCYVVLTVRADFFPDLMASLMWSEIQAHRAEVLPLDEEGLRQAIVRPAEDVGVFVETALVERLVADASGEPGILPFVQETLVLLWEKVERRYLPLRAYEALVLTARSYRELGAVRLTGLQVAMADRAEAALQALSPEQQGIARRIFLRLVQFGEGRADTRRQQPVAALRAASDNPALFEATLGHLTDHRLLTLGGEEEGLDRQVDLAHEALIAGWPNLQQWLAEWREAEQARRRLEAKAAEWVRMGQGSGGLLDEVELAEAAWWLSSPDAAELGYDEILLALVQASRAASEQAREEREAARQRELAQAQALAEAERRHAKAQTRRARLVWGLIGLFALLLTIALLYLSPVYTGWQKMTSLEEFTNGAQGSWQLIVAVSSTNPDLLYVSDQTAGGLYKSADGGISWSHIGVGRLAKLSVHAIAASKQIVYVTTPEDVFISSHGGTRWFPGNLPLDKGSDQQPWAVTVDPNNPMHAYVGTRYAGLFVTIDGGSTWSPVTTQNVRGDWIQAITTNGKDLVVATDRGLWVSRDAAQTWYPFIGLPATPSPVLGLTMPGQKGRFLMALGEAGLGDADVSSNRWIPFPDPPPSPINSVSVSGDSFYASSDRGLLCWRLLEWTDLNWWRYHLGIHARCAHD